MAEFPAAVIIGFGGLLVAILLLKRFPISVQETKV